MSHCDLRMHYAFSRQGYEMANVLNGTFYLKLGSQQELTTLMLEYLLLHIQDKCYFFCYCSFYLQLKVLKIKLSEVFLSVLKKTELY